MPKCDFLIVAGGTGGHVFPALSIALKLRYIGYRITWIGAENSLEEKVAAENKINFIASKSPSWYGRGILAKILIFIPLFQSCFRNWTTIKDLNPKVVLCFGGHVTVPIGIVSYFQSRKLILHEQNVIPGKANKLLALFANKILLGMPSTFGGKKSVFVGNPLRPEVEDKSNSLAKRTIATPLKVLILGGSNGSKTMNEIVADSFGQLGQDFKIWHQTGKKNIAEIREKYQELHKDFYVEEFIDDMADAYLWADIVISRAGAITIAELLAFQKPSILIPNPFCANNHQVDNALYLAEQGVASCYLESDPNISTAIAGKLMYWLSNPQEYYELCEKLGSLSTNGCAEKISDICSNIHDGNEVAEAIE